MAEPESGKPHLFQPGKSGNPSGRPPGSRSKVLVALDALGDEEAKAVLKAMIVKAKDGDTQAGRTILERAWPPRKGRPIEFELPVVDDASGLPRAIGEVNRQVAGGILSPDEGTAIVGLLEAQRKAFETHDFAARLIALEKAVAAR